MFRKILLFVLCMSLLLCVACSDDTPQSTEPITTEQPSETEPTTQEVPPTETTTEPEPSETEEPTQAPTEEVFAPIDPEAPIIEAFTATDTKGNPAITYSCSLPQIQCESSYAQAINQELSELYYNGFNEDGVWWGGNKSFRYYVNGDILSLVIYHYNTENPSDYEIDFRHSIYNLHMSDGSEVTADEILEITGISKEIFREKAQKILGNSLLFTFSEKDLSYYVDVAPSSFVQTVQESNLDYLVPFLNQYGMLSFMGRMYYMAGGFEYQTPLFSFSEDINYHPRFTEFFDAYLTM